MNVGQRDCVLCAKVALMLFVCVTAAGCGSGPEKPLDIPVAGGQEKFVPVQEMIFELDGKRYSSPGTMSAVNDTIIVQEEGLRSFRIVGYGPQDAAVPSVDSVNFYRDVYAFNYSGDSIYILGGDFAKPKNHYVSAVGEGFEYLAGKSLASRLPAIEFYNYVNRSYDYTTVGHDGVYETVAWSSLGRYRLYRIEVFLSTWNNIAGRSEKSSFTLPFYELENNVQIEGATNGIIDISPGDTISLGTIVKAPEEFTFCEWVKGTATGRFSPLNGDAVEKAYVDKISNPLLTENGMRYTDSMVSLGKEGTLSVDSSWRAELALAHGGGVYATIPVSVIFVPEGSAQSGTYRRDFIFPDNSRHSVTPTPFYANALVRILY